MSMAGWLEDGVLHFPFWGDLRIWKGFLSRDGLCSAGDMAKVSDGSSDSRKRCSGVAWLWILLLGVLVSCGFNGTLECLDAVGRETTSTDEYGVVDLPGWK